MKLNEVSMYDNIFKTLKLDSNTDFKLVFRQGILFEYLDFLFQEYFNLNDKEKDSTHVKLVSDTYNKIMLVLDFIFKNSMFEDTNHKLYKEILTKLYENYENRLTPIDKYFFNTFNTAVQDVTTSSYDKLKVLYLILPFKIYYDFIESIIKRKVSAFNTIKILLDGGILRYTMDKNDRNKVVDLIFSDATIYSYFFESRQIEHYFPQFDELSRITTNQALKDYLKSFDSVFSKVDSKDVITNDIMLGLEKMERNNRIKKVLWNGESRIKGNIYPDTIQQMIDNITKGSMKYSEPVEVTIPSKEVTLPDGTKIMTKPKTQLQGKKLLPMDDNTQKQINILKDLLAKSQQKNHVKNTEKINIPIGDARIESIKQYILKSKIYSIIERSEYTGGSMQTLLMQDYQNHKVMMFYIKDFDMDWFSQRFDIDTDEAELEYHQGSDRKDLMLGFIRYHIFGDKIFINTIQTDIGGYIYSGEYISDERDNDLYQFICKRIMQYFIKHQHKKGVTQIVIPNSIMRSTLYESDGVPSIYDDLPKKMGFEKIKFKDTIWYDKTQALSMANTKIAIRQGDFNAWILQGLNESLIKR